MRQAIVQFLLALWMFGTVSLPQAARATDASDIPPSRLKKPDGHVATSGPKVPLAAAQRAALEAKRAVTIVPARAPEPVLSKVDQISTIPADTGAPGLKPPPVAAALGGSSDGRPAVASNAVPRVNEEAAIAAFLAALGSDIGRQAGLIKSSDGSAAPTQARTPAVGGRP